MFDNNNTYLNEGFENTFIGNSPISQYETTSNVLTTSISSSKDETTILSTIISSTELSESQNTNDNTTGGFTISLILLYFGYYLIQRKK